jgi:hypothetical protein
MRPVITTTAVALSVLLALTGRSGAASKSDEGEHGGARGHHEERGEHGDKDREHDRGDAGKHHDDDEHDKGDRKGEHEDDDDRDEDADAGPPVDFHRTEAQTKRRDEIVARERDVLRDIGHRNGPKISHEDRSEMGVHWRHVMRLLRIRELAENDGQKDIVAKCDALLDREDKKFVGRHGEAKGSGATAGQDHGPGQGGAK